MSEATATGTLEATPLSQLLVYALDKRLTGSFVFQGADRQKSALWVEEGVPAKAKTAQPVIHLGRLLLELGKVGEDVYNSTLTQVAKERKLHGKLLLEAGAIDLPTLDAALAEQLLRQVVWMFSLAPKTAYGFYAGRNFLERWGEGSVRVEPLAVLWRGIRRHENLKHVESYIGRLGSRTLHLHASANIARFSLAQNERAIIDVLRAKPQTVEQLAASGVADPSDVKRLIYALTITRHLDVGAPPLGLGREAAGVARAPSPVAPPVVPQSPRVEDVFAANPLPTLGSSPSAVQAALTSSPMAAPPPSTRTPAPTSVRMPASEPPEVAELRREVEELAIKMPNQNYYEMLGVDMKAPSANISAAFFQLAKKWHPDRLGPEYAALKDDVVKVFARMTEAHQKLTDDQSRREYDELVRDGGGTEAEQEEVQKVMRAVVAYQKALVYFRKGNLSEAEEMSKQAREADPEQAEYTALWVQCVSQRPERASKGYADLISVMDDAVKKEPENERVRMARGELLKRAGKLDLAVKDFKWVVYHNPKNLDAAREVRLFTMRGGEPGKSVAPGAKGKDDKGGLIGKFFKR